MHKRLLALAISGLLYLPLVHAYQYAYIPVSTANGILHIINTTTMLPVTEETNPIVVGNYPKAVAISRDGSYVYIALGEGAGEIAILDAYAAELLPNEYRIQGIGDNPKAMAINHDLNRLYVVVDGGLTTILLDAWGTSGSVSNSVEYARYSSADVAVIGNYVVTTGDCIGDCPDGLAGVTLFDADGNYVTELAHGNNLNGLGSSGITVNTNTNDEFYVANRSADNLYVYKLINETIENTEQIEIPLETYPYAYLSPYAVAYDKNRDRVYVSNAGYRNDDAEFFNPASDEIQTGNIVYFDISDTTRTLRTATLALEEPLVAPYGDVIHPKGIALDKDGNVFVIKDTWEQTQAAQGSYLVRKYKSSLPGERLKDGETSVKIAGQGVIFVKGNFIGPECSQCPTGTIPKDIKTVTRLSSSGFFSLFAAFLLIATRLGYGFSKKRTVRSF